MSVTLVANIAPRIERLVASIAKKSSEEPGTLEENFPILEYISRHYPPAWLHVAALHEELGTPEALGRAKVAIRNHLEAAPPDAALSSWRLLADLCRRTGDTVGEVHAFVELSELPNAPFDEISSVANRLNFLLAEKPAALESEEKLILVRRLALVMERRIGEGDAHACSRLAWLCFHLKDLDRAAQHIKRGLLRDPANEYCQRLATKLAYHQNAPRG